MQRRILEFVAFPFDGQRMLNPDLFFAPKHSLSKLALTKYAKVAGPADVPRDEVMLGGDDVKKVVNGTR